ncbi:hypothetical protein Tco_1568762 [Tanacetum coccineum]
MDDPNITMEEYIRLKEEKCRRHGKASLSYELTVIPLSDNEIGFRIAFDESDDEDYTVIFDKKSFSYKIIFVDNLKTDSENDNDKVNMPSFPSPEPTVSYFDDLDYLKDFENEFPAIVYNDALTSKSDFLIEPTINPQYINEFKEISLSECDEEEQNVLYFNDLFPFNIIYPDGLKSDEDNDGKRVDTEQLTGDIFVIPSPDKINTDVYTHAHSSFKNSNLYFKHFKLPEDVVNRILQVVLDLQHFKSSLYIFAATSSSAILCISTIDNFVHQNIKFQSILITSRCVNSCER